MSCEFLDYISPAGNNKIEEWYESLYSEEARTEFDVLLGNLEVLDSWSKPAFRRLKGSKYKGLGEICFIADKIQHRVIGFSGPETGQYTLLIGCTHKQRVYTPANALDTAVRRMRQVKSSKVEVHEHE